MLTSLVLSCYNGSKYIVEQLDSIREQSRLVDEVLIGDDCSIDGTSEMVQSYIEEYKLSNWTLIKNEKNQGWKSNFHNLLRLAHNDLVFLCDQDDVWLREKVFDMAEIMGVYPEIDVLACNAEPFYEDGSQKLSVEHQCGDTGELKRVEIDEKAVYVNRPGCTYCVRKSFLNSMEPYWDETWAHDTLIWMMGEAKGSLYILDRKLIMFRRHGGNASDRKKMNRISRISDIEHLIARVKLIRRFGAEYGSIDSSAAQELEQIERWLHAREEMLESRSIESLRNVLSGVKRYATLKGSAVDLTLSLFRGAEL